MTSKVFFSPYRHLYLTERLEEARRLFKKNIVFKVNANYCSVFRELLDQLINNVNMTFLQIL